MTNKSNAVYIISVAAELSGMHPQTLRIYERKGLIEPYRTPGGTRRYSEEDLERLGLIQELTSVGVNLEGVRRILELQEDNRRLRAQVDRLAAASRRSRSPHVRPSHRRAGRTRSPRPPPPQPPGHP